MQIYANETNLTVLCEKTCRKSAEFNVDAEKNIGNGVRLNEFYHVPWIPEFRNAGSAGQSR